MPNPSITDLVMAQGPATTPLTVDEQAKDDIGYTNPNLHRRVDPQQPTDPDKVKPDSYQLGIYGTNSYRTTTTYYHDEESTTCEIP